MLFSGTSRYNSYFHQSQRGQVGYWNRHLWRHYLLSYIKYALAHSSRLGIWCTFENSLYNEAQHSHYPFPFLSSPLNDANTVAHTAISLPPYHLQSMSEQHDVLLSPSLCCPF